MTQAELQIVIAELREQNRLNRQMQAHTLSELERMEKRREQEYDVSRRFQAETTALQARLMAQMTAAMQDFARTMGRIDRRMARAERRMAGVERRLEGVEGRVDDSTDAIRAGTRALLRVIDRMNRLDGGASAS